jgi:hypothetical protein
MGTEINKWQKFYSFESQLVILKKIDKKFEPCVSFNDVLL